MNVQLIRYRLHELIRSVPLDALHGSVRVGVVGSRDFDRLDVVAEVIKGLPRNSIVVSGGARGVDQAAEQAALDCGLPVIVHRPDWDRFGRGAGIIRNGQIISDSDVVIAFWDGESKGTLDSMRKAQKQCLPLTVVQNIQD